MQGGHTLPRKFTQLTLYSPAHSSAVTSSFSAEKSSRIIQSCRENNLTFGNAFPVLAQVALTRLLCRRYVRGDIDSDEWEYRRKQPMTTAGPLSLRPFLDKGWFERGGVNNISLSIGFFFHVLPFMPLGSASDIKPGDNLPGFHDLLSFPRFLLRCHSIKRQSVRLTKHPLFLDISASRSLATVERLRSVALRWQDKQDYVDNQTIPVNEQSPVLTHGGSSIGNVSSLFIPTSFS